jgi:hypothetical protein
VVALLAEVVGFGMVLSAPLQGRIDVPGASLV